MPDYPQKSYAFKVLGFALSFLAPSKTEDVERMTAKNSVIEGYFDQYCYHDRGPAFKEKFAEKLEVWLANHAPEGTQPETRGFRMEKNKKDGEADKKVWTESAKAFYDRVKASNLIPAADAEALAKEVNDEMGDWTASKVSQRKPGEEYYTKARELMPKVDANRTGFLAAAERNLGAPFSELFGDVNLDNVARYLKAVYDKKQEEAKRAAEAELGFDDASEGSETDEEQS